MNEVEELIIEAEMSSSVAFTRFVLLVDHFGDAAFYYFVEGKDAPYYYPRIQSICEEKEPIPIKCGGKSKVLDVFNLISAHSTYNKYKKAFLVDRDYDDNSMLPVDIYITPCYSIENFYADKSVIAEILKCEFDILPLENNFDKILGLYISELKQFHEAIMEFNAWYACLKQITSQTGVSLGDNMPVGFVNIQIGNIKKMYTLSNIETVYQGAIAKISQNDIQRMIQILDVNPTNLLRGKYQIQFLEKFLRFLIEDANNRNQRNYVTQKTTFNIERASILSQLSQYAITPDCLSKYILDRLAS